MTLPRTGERPRFLKGQPFQTAAAVGLVPVLALRNDGDGDEAFDAVPGRSRHALPDKPLQRFQHLVQPVVAVEVLPAERLRFEDEPQCHFLFFTLVENGHFLAPF